MKVFLIIGLAMAALCACHRGAQNTISPSSPIGAPGNEASDGIEKEKIMQLERDWGDALAKRDLVALDRILGDDQSVITKDGSVLTKAQELAKHIESLDELFDLEPMKVRIFGGAAVVTGGHWEKSQYNGRDTSGHYRWMDVFVKRNGRWGRRIRVDSRGRRETVMQRVYFSSGPNQALELTATRRVFTFQMIKTVSVQATLVLGGGCSACSR